MSLDLNSLAKRVVVAGVTLPQALELVSEAVSLIGVVEHVYDGLKGDVKFKAVMAAMDQVVDQMGLSAKLTQIRKALAPLVNLVVAILNGANLWASLFASITQPKA